MGTLILYSMCYIKIMIVMRGNKCLRYRSWFLIRRGLGKRAPNRRQFEIRINGITSACIGWDYLSWKTLQNIAILYIFI